MDVLIELFDPKTGSWHSVVCFEGFGSCNYTNVCELLSLVTQCPDPLIAAGIPCECPFMQVCYGNVLNTWGFFLVFFFTSDHHKEGIYLYYLY